MNDNTIEEPFIITNLINNPFGYYFETPVDVGDSSVENSLYTKGEIRLIMKNAEYSTDLPTVFYEVEYSDI